MMFIFVYLISRGSYTELDGAITRKENQVGR